MIIPEGDFIPPEWSKSIKNYIQTPKPSGYQSIHFVLRHPTTGSTIEFQIRTKQMHEIAEEGYYTEVTPSIRHPVHNKDIMEGIMNGQYGDDDAILEELGIQNPSSVSHKIYKEHKYPHPVQYDRFKIRLSGFELSPSGELLKDTSGFEKPFYLFEL